MALRQLFGASERLHHFDPTHFRDFVWRSMFARTLHADDLASVTSAQFRTTRVPWKGMHFCALVTRKLGYPMHPRLDTSGIDVMIAETPYTGRVSRGTNLVVRYHDAIPVLMPHTISDKARHRRVITARSIATSLMAHGSPVCPSPPGRICCHSSRKSRGVP